MYRVLEATVAYATLICTFYYYYYYYYCYRGIPASRYFGDGILSSRIVCYSATLDYRTSVLGIGDGRALHVLTAARPRLPAILLSSRIDTAAIAAVRDACITTPKCATKFTHAYCAGQPDIRAVRWSLYLYTVFRAKNRACFHLTVTLANLRRLVF